jgi:hypothetical protein
MMERALREYASCMILYVPHRVTRLLEAEPGSKLERVRLEAFLSPARVGSYCMTYGGVEAADRGLFRGVLAETAYRHQFARMPAISLPPPPSPILGRGADAGIRPFALCAVQANPSGVDALLRTQPGVQAKEAMATLAPGFSACAPRWRESGWSSLEIRAALAETLFAAARGRLASLKLAGKQ